jgi:hypothetical protein
MIFVSLNDTIVNLSHVTEFHKIMSSRRLADKEREYSWKIVFNFMNRTYTEIEYQSKESMESDINKIKSAIMESQNKIVQTKIFP